MREYKGASSRGGNGGSSKSLSSKFTINADDFCHVDDTSFQLPYTIDVNFCNEVHHEALDRCYGLYMKSPKKR